jgi:hypothetical protein
MRLLTQRNQPELPLPRFLCFEVAEVSSFGSCCFQAFFLGVKQLGDSENLVNINVDGATVVNYFVISVKKAELVGVFDAFFEV